MARVVVLCSGRLTSQIAALNPYPSQSYIGLEKYVMSKISSIAFGSPEEREKDEELRRTIRVLRHVPHHPPLLLSESERIPDPVTLLQPYIATTQPNGDSHRDLPLPLGSW